MLKLSKPLNDVNWHVLANITFQKPTQIKQFCIYKVQNNHRSVGQRHDPIFSPPLSASFGNPAKGYPGSSALQLLSSEAAIPLGGAV